MAKRPPDDNPWAEVMDQLKDALDEAHITDGATRDALMAGLHEAFSSLGELGSSVFDPRDGPDVTVVEGGRAEGEPVEDRPRPDLRVADEVPEDPGPRPMVTNVRVIRGKRDPRASTDGGWIAVDGRDAWQTVFVGEAPRAYRLLCTSGALRVALDGSPAFELGAGQSSDCEARLVRVASASEAAAEGRYLRLGGGR